MDDRKSTVIGRMPVERAIRLRATEPEPSPAQPAAAKGPACPRCGAVLCDPARAKMFKGMVLTCNGCGEKHKI